MLNVLKRLPQWLTAVIRGQPGRPVRRQSRAPFLVIGHRGSPCVAIENTMPSFRRAVEQEGANGIECDLCLTRDAQIVLWHDWDPDEPTARLREAGWEPVVGFCPAPPPDGVYRRPICELTLAEFSSHFGYRAKASGQQYYDGIPRLDELLAWMGERREIAALFLDIKVPAARTDLLPVMLEGIQRLLERYRPPATIILECAAVEVLTVMQAYAPQYQYALDSTPPPGIVVRPAPHSAVGPALQYGNAYATLARPRATTLAPWTTHRRIVQHDLRLLHGLQHHESERPIPALISFTIDKEHELRTLVMMGVDGIQTNRPAVLRRLTEALRVRPVSPQYS